MTDPLDGALCRTLDASPWLDPPYRRAPAVQACRACPALQPCRGYTLALIDRGKVPAGVVQAARAWPRVQVSPRRARAMLAAAG